MRHGWIVLTSVLIACANAQAQIYVCEGKDGTRVFSDEKCGPDAKVVPGITSKKRPAPGAAAKAAKTPPKTPEQLEELIKLCNTGDIKACTQWTHGGGPKLLRDKERKAELACEGGSLPDCEERYCRDGANEECRIRVLQSAKLSGDTWYVRDEVKRREDGAAVYNIRCIREGQRETVDATIVCDAFAGPSRCSASNAEQGFARMDHAASSFCSQPQ